MVNVVFVLCSDLVTPASLFIKQERDRTFLTKISVFTSEIQVELDRFVFLFVQLNGCKSSMKKWRINRTFHSGSYL